MGIKRVFIEYTIQIYINKFTRTNLIGSHYKVVFLKNKIKSKVKREDKN